MAAEVDYEWKLRLRLAENGIYKASELRPLLAERGVRLSDSQTWRLITGRPERLSLRVLAILCDLLACTPDALIEVTTVDRQARLDKAAAGDRSIAGLTPERAHIRLSPHDRQG